MDHSPGEQKDNERNYVKSPVLLRNNIKSQTRVSSFYRLRRLIFFSGVSSSDHTRLQGGPSPNKMALPVSIWEGVGGRK